MVVIENCLFKLELRENCVVQSLVLKSTGEECIQPDDSVSFFSVVQERPFHNEIKLMHPNKRTVFHANRIRREGNRLVVGFELMEIEAVVNVREEHDYVSFTLAEFIVPENAYGLGCKHLDPPPIYSFRLAQLPLMNRKRFGDWLNVMWDDKVAINLLSTSPYALVDSETRKDCRILYADAMREVKLLGSSVAIIVSPPDQLLDCIDRFESDFNLPKGVKSRRSDGMDESVYWSCDISPENIDQHLEYARKGGFKKMLLYYTVFFKEGSMYSLTGDYDINDHFPGGLSDVKAFVKKIKDAGIAPGLHFLHSHIGIKSRYVTPSADHRLNLTRYFTLAKQINGAETVIYVEENPEGAPLHPEFRVLKFGGEVICYEGYTTEFPYTFYGCKRGHYDTNILHHPLGEIGGILDVSEFGATSVYVNERTSLQDEVAEKIASLYNEAGFAFIYFDGSEGTNPPFEFNVPYAQYRVYKKLDREPLFCEGAAKAHFGWHMLSGGNAFDIFPAKVFKEKIAEYPLSEAPNMANNFTRLDFGWWAFNQDSQPDMYEYGTGKAAAYNCPGTIQVHLPMMAACARREDILEVMYRWEDVKHKHWLTQEQKELLKNPDQEYILLVNEIGDYELVPYFCIKNTTQDDSLFTAYYFERRGRTYVVCWHGTGSGHLVLSLDAEDIIYEEQLGGNRIQVQKVNDGIVIPIAGRRYFSTTVTKEKLVEVFEKAVVID